MPDVIRVLMVISNLKIADGVAKFAMTYYSHLDHRKIHMDFALYDSENINDEYAKQIKENDSRIFVLPPVKDIRKHTLYCRKLFQKRHYDIVHDNSLINTIPLMREAAKAKIPVRILHAHATKLGETRAKEVRNRIFFPILKYYTNTYSACTEAAGRFMFENSAFKIISNVVHGEQFLFEEKRRNDLRKKYGLTDEKLVITVGRMAPQKNPYFAIDVMKSAIRYNHKIRYWWIGNGPLENDIKNYINTLNCRNEISLIESQNHIEDFYMAADLFLLPSLFEGLGIVAVEAQATGLPCLISNTIPQDVDYTNKIERMSLNTDVECWSKKIVKMLDRNDSEQERKKSYKDLKKSIFCDEKAGSNLEEYYTNLLKNKGIF